MKPYGLGGRRRKAGVKAAKWSSQSPAYRMTNRASLRLLLWALGFGGGGPGGGGGADRGMYFILRLTQLIVRPDSRLGLLRYKSPPNAYYLAHSVIPA